ncbi:hypothetical protein BOX15_Mlig017258g1 [Macrostomum lignano]|uniref:Uncharacterized protein n=1 Tax=Macrostomum lignano TaxID=282301 RepID=A0A267FGJ3_9PLAT|nr:hypothetical protein BOX15_Mlig017258g1 [Macrostomum lignano]
MRGMMGVAPLERPERRMGSRCHHRLLVTALSKVLQSDFFQLRCHPGLAFCVSVSPQSRPQSTAPCANTFSVAKAPCHCPILSAV